MSASQNQTTTSFSAEFVQAKRINLTLTGPSAGLSEWLQTISSSHQLGFFKATSVPTQFERALHVLIANILMAKDEKYLVLSKSWADYPAPSRYHSNPVPLSAIIAATEFLKQKNWLVIHPGSQHSGLKTRIEPTAALQQALKDAGLWWLPLASVPAEEAIVLRDQAKQLVEYTDTPRTLQHRRNLTKINSFLRQQEAVLNGQKLNTDLVRIFKDSFIQGGRFYRADHMRAKSGVRSQIILNGESVVEIDFSCLHVNMLYIQETGMPFEGDAYAVENSPVPRDVYKIILQIILNCESEFAAVRAADQALKAAGFQVSALTAIQTFLKKHRRIRNHFFTGVGLKLQYLDSVIAEHVLLQGCANNIPVLPVHDSFLVPQSQEQWLTEAMARASSHVLGCALPVKIKRVAAASQTA